MKEKYGNKLYYRDKVHDLHILIRVHISYNCFDHAYTFLFPIIVLFQDHYRCVSNS